jgi:hypothetical protein
LIWCYKTTKEELDRIDRKFTQLKVDDHLLKFLVKKQEKFPPELMPHYNNQVENFKRYMDDKEKGAYGQKFVDKERKVLQPHYCYLQNRLAAIEKTIVTLLGKKELTAIEESYEKEMTRRIWESREHT